MLFGLDNEDIEKIKVIFKTHPAVESVTVFGSRAMGSYKPGSDIDMVIKGNVSFSELLTINNELEDIGLLYTFDIQNIANITDRDVLDHISRVGKPFYTR